ncbi:hypothetical protein FA95DRAFT_1594302 [Auriscalpium vulgare]|uniref:Uncharacterized protein n=1 Tax=Auriscalpium vulgare TaxID=40419 RepID=A0ACB8S0D2_9AGAM|nr:hypothetical protein FA95DRAFT_1594302 [Auriscalpium vulgare]
MREPALAPPVNIHPRHVSTPFDPAPLFEYPFPNRTRSPDGEQAPFAASSPVFVPPPPTLYVVAFVLSPPILPRADSSISSISSASTSAASEPVLHSPSHLSTQNPRRAAAASARNPPVPPAIARRQLTHKEPDAPRLIRD